MNLTKQKLVRIADNIRDQLLTLKGTRQKQVEQKSFNVAGQIERLQRLQRYFTICVCRKWNAGVAQMMRSIENVCREISNNVQDVERAIKAWDIKVPALKDIFGELVQVDEEFGNLGYDRDGKFLSVVTEPIDLEGIHLGEFEIRLHIQSLSDVSYNTLYTIVALDPNPAASNECVTHPHVSDERLCPGDAGAAIQTALASGRICDFFMLVNSVLTHYNADSPYVSLDNWNGVSCYECGYVMADDDTRWCNACENNFCGECASYCICCQETYCLNCLAECAACQEQVCPSCMKRCPTCGRQICEICLEDNRCPCIEESEEDDDEHDENPSSESGEVQPVAASAGTENTEGPVPATTSSAVHADSVGEAAVLP